MKQPASDKLTFIILSFNSARFLNKCFESIREKCIREKIPYEVIVVDNGSTDGSLEICADYVRKHGELFKVIELSENRGTTYTRNLAIKKAAGRHLCVLDSDTEIGPGSIAEILQLLDTAPEIGLISPKLLLPGDIVQNSVKRFPTFLHKLLKIPLAVLKIPVPHKDFYEDFPFDTPTEVETAISACWFFQKKLIEKIGLLDERIFYAPEDIEFCVRVHKAGMKILYYPALTILHHTQQISHKKPFSKLSISHAFGLFYYFRKHGGWFSTENYFRSQR